MNNNDVMRSIRYALSISDPKMIEVFKAADFNMEQATLERLLKKEEEEGYAPCNDATLAAFLNGLIYYKRGKKEGQPEQPVSPKARLTNNDILKKIRIALEFKEEDMLHIMTLGEMPISKNELTALFRKPGHTHFKECGDQFLRNFLRGLTILKRMP